MARPILLRGNYLPWVRTVVLKVWREKRIVGIPHAIHACLFNEKWTEPALGGQLEVVCWIGRMRNRILEMVAHICKFVSILFILSACLPNDKSLS